MATSGVPTSKHDKQVLLKRLTARNSMGDLFTLQEISRQIGLSAPTIRRQMRQFMIIAKDCIKEKIDEED